MHLSPEFGMTIQEIRADGFEPDEAIEILLSSDTSSAICKSMGLAIIGYDEALQRLQPEPAASGQVRGNLRFPLDISYHGRPNNFQLISVK